MHSHTRFFFKFVNAPFFHLTALNLLDLRRKCKCILDLTGDEFTNTSFSSKISAFVAKRLSVSRSRAVNPTFVYSAVDVCNNHASSVVQEFYLGTNGGGGFSFVFSMYPLYGAGTVRPGTRRLIFAQSNCRQKKKMINKYSLKRVRRPRWPGGPASIIFIVFPVVDARSRARPNRRESLARPQGSLAM